MRPAVSLSNAPCTCWVLSVALWKPWSASWTGAHDVDGSPPVGPPRCFEAINAQRGKVMREQPRALREYPRSALTQVDTCCSLPGPPASTSSPANGGTPYCPDQMMRRRLNDLVVAEQVLVEFLSVAQPLENDFTFRFRSSR